MTIDRWLTAADPDAPAVHFEGKTIPYGSVRARTQAWTAAFQAMGLQKGDRIAWLGLNHPDVFALLFAAARTGLILVPLNWRLSRPELADILADCAPKLLIHDDAFAQTARALDPTAIHHQAPLPGTEPAARTGAETDPILIVYTSGSTGTPKGVVLSQRALIANAAMSVEAHALTQADRALVVLPLFHVGGLNILPTPAFSIGASVELHPRFDPAAALDALNRCTVAITVPTVLQAIMAERAWPTAPLPHLRALSIGSTDVPRALIDAIHARDIPLIQIYGATETAPLAIYQRPDTAMATPGSIGTPGSRCAIRLVVDGSDADPGQPGEIWVKGDNILTCYWNNPGLTARAMPDGWFATGDVATRDPTGNYYFTDRIRNVIISGGENIYPAELERILNAHPDIEEAAVVGRPDPRWGTIPVAAVVSGRLDRAAVLALFDGTLARYKHPRDVVFLDALPRNAMGKIVTDAVRAALSGAG